MFEIFNVPNIALVPKSVLPLYSHGKTTGLVVDSGYDETQVVPVYHGYPLQHAIRIMPIGGRHITQIMMELINERGYNLTTPKGLDHVIAIKEQFCYSACDFKKELAVFTKDMEQQYTLPDGMIVSINIEAFRSTEVMFDPALFNVNYEQGGIHNIIFKACSACNVKEQPNMYENIVLSGGNTLFPFLTDRLENMMAKLVLSKIEISARPERKFSTWIGGSILASVPNFEKMCIGREEYEEHGAQIVHKKCFE